MIPAWCDTEQRTGEIALILCVSSLVPLPLCAPVQANVNAANERGFTALLRAAEEGNTKIYQVKLTRGGHESGVVPGVNGELRQRLTVLAVVNRFQGRVGGELVTSCLPRQTRSRGHEVCSPWGHPANVSMFLRNSWVFRTPGTHVEREVFVHQRFLCLFSYFVDSLPVHPLDDAEASGDGFLDMLAVVNRIQSRYTQEW